MRLRDDVTISEDRGQDGEPVLIVVDRLTRRFFSLPHEALEILTLLREPRLLDDLIAACEEGIEPDEVRRLVKQLEARHLLIEEIDEATLRSEVEIEQRSARWTALKRVLHYAADHVPVYKKTYAGIDLGSVAREDDLHRIPLTDKADIRANYPDGFVPDNVDLHELTITDQVVRGVSSGTSAGERLQTLHTRDAWRRQMIAGAALNGELFPNIESPNATFTTMHCADADVCVTHLAQMEDRIRAGTRLLLFPPEDPGAPTKAEVEHTLEELRAHGAVWIDCNPTYMAALSYAILDSGMETPKINVLTSGFEFLSEIHRPLLRRVWGCNVYNRFSASELGNYVALECELGGFHFNDLYYYAEVLRDGRHVAPGEVGHLVVTTLQETLPLIRYETNDLVIAAAAGPCPCGSVTTRVASFEGRRKDIVVASDGSPRTERQIDTALAAVEGLRFYQLAQATQTKCALKVVADPSSNAAQVRARAGEALSAVLGGGAEIRVDGARRLYPEASGKFRFTRSDVEERESLIVTYSDRQPVA